MFFAQGQAVSLLPDHELYGKSRLLCYTAGIVGKKLYWVSRSIDVLKAVRGVSGKTTIKGVFVENMSMLSPACSYGQLQ
jgi:hypothetical protein